VDGCVDVGRFISVTVLAPRLTVTDHQTGYDHHVGADVDTQRQHVRTPEDIRVLGRQNAAVQINNNNHIIS